MTDISNALQILAASIRSYVLALTTGLPLLRPLWPVIWLALNLAPHRAGSVVKHPIQARPISGFQAAAAPVSLARNAPEFDHCFSFESHLRDSFRVIFVRDVAARESGAT